MKKWILLHLLSLFFSTQIYSQSEKINLVVLNFINKTDLGQGVETAQYDFMGKMIADEFRFVLSKAANVNITSPEPLYDQLSLFQKKGQDSGERGVLSFLHRYENKKKTPAFTHILFGEFQIKDNQIRIQIQLKKRGEELLPVIHEDKDFPELNRAELWQLNACAKASFLAEKQFGLSQMDSYTKTCLKPDPSSSIFASSKKVYFRIQEMEKEIASLQKIGSSKACPQKCLSETEEDKTLECLQTCETNASLQRQNLELSRVHLGGYVETETLPRNVDSSLRDFRDKYLDFIIETLKLLPSNASLRVQGRISKKYSSRLDLFDKSKEKAEKAKEILKKEILARDKDAEKLLGKLRIEACGDICFREYPSQLDSSGQDNDVTFVVRVNNKK